MKLVRWTLAGASFYVIYKYAIGKKAKGEQVFATPENGDGSTADKPASTPSGNKPD
jgi:hypothetical protein